MEYIRVYENSLNPDTCDQMVTIFENHDMKHPGETFEGVSLNMKITTDLHSFHWGRENKELDNLIAQELTRKLNQYFRDVNVPPIPNLKDTGYQIQKYDKNVGLYHYHHDFIVSPDCSFRVLTFLWYLNDVSEGGETEFQNLLLITPQKGKLVLFPSTWTYPHRGKMPLSNDKYIMTGWVYGRIDINTK